MAGPQKRVSLLCIKFKPDVKLEAACHKVARLWENHVGQRSQDPLAELLSSVRVQSWKQYRRPFVAAMEKEQTMLTVMFAMVGITTVFIVFVVFYMVVSHKSKDIGILKSIGVSRLNLVKLFLDFAVLVAVLGSFMGVLGGWLFLRNINKIESWLFEHFRFQLWDRTIYAIGDIPNRVDFQVLAVIVASAFAACLAGALIPSWQAARAEPVETLRVAQL
jgi:lipoprotein-releasing system permease protein